MFFPRLIWKDGYNRRYHALIPKEVQELWISEVVMPACQEVFKYQPGIHKYIPSSIQELHWKSGDHKLDSLTVTSKNSISHLVRSMKSIVQSNIPLLGRFGLFFFAVDARGIKLVTKQCLESKESPELVNIFSAFDDLNWK